MKYLAKLVRESFCINNKTKLHFSGDNSLINCVNVIDAHLFDDRANAVLCTEVQHLLGLGNATNIVPGQHFATTDEVAHRDSQLLRRQTDNGHDSPRL